MNKLMILVLMAVLILAGLSNAQSMQRDYDRRTAPRAGQRGEWDRGPRHMERMGIFELPDLTEEQRAKLEDLQVEQMKAIQPLRNKLLEKRAELHSLSTVEDINLGKINALIDEIGKIRTDMMKEREKYRQAIRKILTEKQRLIFDSRPWHRRGIMAD